MEIVKADNYRESVIALLTAEKLPVADLPGSLTDFLVAVQDNHAVGVAGLEIYGFHGLLRSVAISPGFRARGLAEKLVQRIEALAALKNLGDIYLLTENTPAYFERHGYQKIERKNVPAEVQQSPEFSHMCPASAIVMKKILTTQ